ncbi:MULTISPECIES: hypothetical protein [unclassified Variovorax]|jgi:hypothetical protein|uniref:hypothetical protein n=1 Tax=unclassified Variovorax TaxID=663243 RepID=UPI003F4918C5
MNNPSPSWNWKTQINMDWRPRLPNGADAHSVAIEMPAALPTRSKWKSDDFAAVLLQ